MKVINNGFPSIAQVTDQYLKPDNTGRPKGENQLSFQDILKQTRQSTETDSGLKFSKHAAGRLADRNIELSDSQLDRLSEGTKKADAKGINESLVIVDQLAFIVNVKNSTVITAMDQAETNESVFTNIDGAVII